MTTVVVFGSPSKIPATGGQSNTSTVWETARSLGGTPGTGDVLSTFFVAPNYTYAVGFEAFDLSLVPSAVIEWYWSLWRTTNLANGPRTGFLYERNWPPGGDFSVAPVGWAGSSPVLMDHHNLIGGGYTVLQHDTGSGFGIYHDSGIMNNVSGSDVQSVNAAIGGFMYVFYTNEDNAPPTQNTRFDYSSSQVAGTSQDPKITLTLAPPVPGSPAVYSKYPKRILQRDT